MLPPFIIDQIRRREEDERHAPQPVRELPLPMRVPPDQRPHADDEGERGVVIIDL